MFTPKNQEKDNLTGGQIQQVLDTLIMSALSPILRASKAFDLQITYLLGTATLNRKRKISALPREEFLTALCNALVAKTAEQQIEIIAQCKIERNVLMTFVENFITSCEDYERIYVQWLASTSKQERMRLGLKLRAIETNVQANPDVLFSTLQTARDYLALAFEFRNSVVERYILHSMKNVRAFASDKQGNLDVNCMHQNVMAAVTKAIDKYDSSKGALTSYIQFWAFNAMTSPSADHGHEYGIAFTIPQAQKRIIALGGSDTVNFSHSLEHQVDEQDDRSVSEVIPAEEQTEEDEARDTEIKAMRVMAKLADHKGGIGRLWLDIEEVFSKKEKERMKEIMIEQGIIQGENNGRH